MEWNGGEHIKSIYLTVPRQAGIKVQRLGVSFQISWDRWSSRSDYVGGLMMLMLVISTFQLHKIEKFNRLW